jgi:hypothetical protein
MTPKASNTRLATYVALAVLVVLLPELENFKKLIVSGTPILPIDWLIIAVKSALAGGVAFRAYIDTSESQVQKP